MSLARQDADDSLAGGRLAAPTFRLASGPDVPDLYDLLLTMHDEVGMATLAPLKVVQAIENVLETGFCVVAEIDGEIVGSIGLDLREWWYSEDVFFGDRWVFVHPDYRKSSIAAGMLRKAISFADKADIPLVVGVFSPKDVERKNALFRRHFSPVGETFIRGLK